MFCENVFCLLVALCILQMTKGNPFLYNPSALPALLSSASASSSSQQSQSNIADLRAKKTERLQEEKQGPPEDDDFSFKDATEEDANEVAPSLLQKKVSKIINKLRFIAQLSNFGNKDDSKDDFDNEFDEEEEDKPEGESKNKTNVLLTLNMPKKNSTSKLKLQPDQEELEPTASVESLEDFEEKKKQSQPDKITINIQTDKIKRESPRGNLSLSPGDVGVFFVELLGSILGLAYGAVAQAGQVTSPASV